MAQARRLGFSGAQVIHPAQVPILNRQFSPSESEISWAEKIIQAADAAAAQGVAAFAVEGKMVDRPIIERAKRILASRRDDARPGA